MLPWLDPDDDSSPFPDLNTALEDPNGLLAAGGSLRPQRLLAAYKQGIFPWFEDDQPILWWSPNPRMTLHPEDLHISRSLKKAMNKSPLHCTYDQAFSEVIQLCSAPRETQDGTWITSSMISAYEELHALGHAHSIEVWFNDSLVGGLYGISVGQAFFGESMFSRQDNASKIGFAYLCQQLGTWEYQLIDCQVHSEHLSSLGASTMTRNLFEKQLKELCNNPTPKHAWLTT